MGAGNSVEEAGTFLDDACDVLKAGTVKKDSVNVPHFVLPPARGEARSDSSGGGFVKSAPGESAEIPAKSATSSESGGNSGGGGGGKDAESEAECYESSKLSKVISRGELQKIIDKINSLVLPLILDSGVLQVFQPPKGKVAHIVGTSKPDNTFGDYEKGFLYRSTTFNIAMLSSTVQGMLDRFVAGVPGIDSATLRVDATKDYKPVNLYLIFLVDPEA